MNLVTNIFNEHQQVINLVAKRKMNQIEEIGKLMVSVLSQGGTIYWCGNGGSAADCQHLSAEFIGRFNGDRRPLRSFALTADSSALTCVANDYNYEDIFSRQVEAYGRQGDLLVGISTSGNSINVLCAFRVAKARGLYTVGLLGKEGGKAVEIVDHSIIIPSQSTARIQEAYILIGHCLCDLVEEGLGIS